MGDAMSAWLTVLLLVVGCLGCGRDHDPADGGAMDGGAGDAADSGDAGVRPMTDGGMCAAGMVDGCPCTDRGFTMCGFRGDIGTGIQCCGGRWAEFVDGPCWPVDAGAPMCDLGATPGCSCTSEGEIACPSRYQWELVCSGGVWAEVYGRVCC